MSSENQSVREFISQLKSTVLSPEFQKLEQLLTDRENETKSLVTAEAKYQMAHLKCLRLEAELAGIKEKVKENPSLSSDRDNNLVTLEAKCRMMESRCLSLEAELEDHKMVLSLSSDRENQMQKDLVMANAKCRASELSRLRLEAELAEQKRVGEEMKQRLSVLTEDLSSSADRGNELQKNLEMAKAESDMIRVKCLQLEGELRVHERVREEMAERITTLSEDLSLSSERVKRADEKYAKCEAEKRVLMEKVTVGEEENARNLEKVARLTEDLGLSSERVKRAEEKCAMISREILEYEAEKTDLIEKIKVLNGDRSRAELSVWKRKYVEFVARVARLEEDLITLSNCNTCSKPMIEKNAGKHGAEQPKSFTVIDIDDSDDEDGLDTRKTCVENLKRKRDSTVVNGENDNLPDGNIKQKKFQEHVNVPKSSFAAPPTSHEQGFITPCTKKPEEKLHPQVLLNSSDSDDKLENENDYYSDLNRTVSNLQAREWAHEADMLSAFDKNKELCLSAVCALHRQSCGRGNSWESSVPFRSKGFTMLDAQRIARLAVLLTDGDVQGTVKKPVSELENSDIEECQNLAKKYSTQLFNIHCKKEDLFFQPL